jgi:flap endonuclease-1
MGIKDLNKYLKTTVSRNAIKKISLEKLHGKTIAIDTSIYLYKFTEQGDLLGKFEEMIHIFTKNNIHPFFVFDGKPPEEKMNELKERTRVKKEAEQKFKELEKELAVMGEGAAFKEKQEVLLEMDELKGKFVKVKKQDIVEVKNYFTETNISFYEAPGEADVVIAYLCNSGKVWGVLSEDMDFFLYGCENILKNLKLSAETVILYETKKILKDLHVSLDSFREITVLAGTDYNVESKDRLSLFQIWRFYYKYRDDFARMSFYKWLQKNHPEIDIDINQLEEIAESFDVYKNNYYKENAKDFQKIKV